MRRVVTSQCTKTSQMIKLHSLYLGRIDTPSAESQAAVLNLLVDQSTTFNPSIFPSPVSKTCDLLTTAPTCHLHNSCLEHGQHTFQPLMPAGSWTKKPLLNICINSPPVGDQMSKTTPVWLIQCTSPLFKHDVRYSQSMVTTEVQ